MPDVGPEAGAPAAGPGDPRWYTAAAVRERAEAIFAACERGALEHWRLDASRLDEVASRVVGVTREAYPDVRAIPYHSRWRHFGAGGVDRARHLEDRLRGLDAGQKLATHFELAITSVLLDAGAGDRWTYRDAGGATYARSEGLAVASYDLFVAGAFSSDPSGAPLRADAEGLARASAAALARGMQVDASNPLVGLEGRAAILRRLGDAVRDDPEHFAHPFDRSAPPRLGHLGLHLRAGAEDAEVQAANVLSAVLAALGPIWPARGAPGSGHVGDVWVHKAIGPVPLHKLSQWLAYSLCEPLEWAGARVGGIDALTGLAEYRNGGLFVDAGVLRPVDPRALDVVHDVASDLVVEWRALTVALLDRTAERVRALLDVSAADLPLARVLEGGTWRAGRAIASEKRAGGGPPLRVRSDGTVF
jgi:hypothetical protein